MTNFEISDATPDEISAIEQQVRYVDSAAKRVALRKIKEKEDAKNALLDNLETKKKTRLGL
jgi:hypothetical protein